MTPNDELNIHMKIVAATTPGIGQGIMTRTRASERPRKGWLSSTAVNRPIPNEPTVPQKT